MGMNMHNKDDQKHSMHVVNKFNEQIQIIPISWDGNKINLRANKFGVHCTTATNAGLCEL